MTDREKHDPNSQGYTNAVLDGMDDKIQAVLEATAPIPEMRGDISSIKEKVDRIEPSLDVSFEEVGSLRHDFEILKAAMKLLDRYEERIDKIDQRLSAVEQQVRS